MPMLDLTTLFQVIWVTRGAQACAKKKEWLALTYHNGCVLQCTWQ